MELLHDRRLRRHRSPVPQLVRVLVALCSILWGCLSASDIAGCDGWTVPPTSDVPPPRTTKKNGQVLYQYFGYGSNVLPSTMRALRGVDVVDATAAVLFDYQLRFYGSASGDGKQLAETSAAFVEPSDRSVVHGVLYTVTADDFATVGRTEGVPWAYRWQRCRVYPYRGDGDRAGAKSSLGDGGGAAGDSVEAYTLVPPPTLRRGSDVPPSASYLGLIQEGARLWKFDQSYQTQLANIDVASNLLIRNGVSELVLRIAERATGTPRRYMIPNRTTVAES